MQRVAFVVGPGFPVMSVAARAAFEFANVSVERPFYDVRVLSEAGGRVTSSLGLAVETKRFGGAMFDTVIVTGTMDIIPASRGVLAFVRKAAKRSRRVASIFTGAFILIGALRGRSLSGLVSLLVFLAVPFAFLYALPGREHYAVSGYARQAYGHLQDDGAFSDGFMGLNHQVLTIFNLHDFGQPTRDIAGFVRDVNVYLYGSPLALAVMAFIAFAYTYHYLNWFSKTSIIRWHEIPRARAIMVVLVWLTSVALCLYDYRLGLQWLFFLSFTHVVLEFPLNHLTFVGIGREIGGLLRGEQARVAPAAAGRAVKGTRRPQRQAWREHP